MPSAIVFGTHPLIRTDPRMTKRKSRARKVLEKPQLLGWNTSDADEIQIRQWRGRAEIAKVEALDIRG